MDDQAMRKILLTGATGFTGRHVVPLLLERYGEVTCLVRRASVRTGISLPGVRFVEGDIDDSVSLAAALEGMEALVNIAYLVGRSECGARRAEGVVRAARTAGVRRAVFLSSTSIFTTLDAPAKSAKLAAEAAVAASGLDYTILRPTMIYGTRGDRNLFRMIRFLRRSPLILVPGDGRSRQQPIHVEDLARAIVDCLEVEATYRKAYNLSGAEAVTFNELIDQTCEALGVRRMKVHVPLGPALFASRLLGRVRAKPWIKEEQLLRLNEDKSFEHGEARRDFGFSPRTFAEGIREEAAQC
jgi:nucleoside-diphosphate-sugar epimerase